MFASAGSIPESCSPAVLLSVSSALCCLQCRLRPITSTLISPLRARKYHAIIQFCKIQSSQVQHFFTRVLLWCPDFPHQINAWLLSNRFVAFSSALFSFHRSIFISTVGFSNEENCCLSQEMGKFIKENLLKGIFRVD